jgi:predicted aspartyl protease
MVLALLGFCLPPQSFCSVSCSVIHHPAPTEADKAFLAADYAKAENLYRSALAANPGDVDLTLGLVHALLRDQKVEEAAGTVNRALTASPASAALLTLRGEVELRAGEPWTASQTAQKSMDIDPCNPRTLLLFAHLFDISSNYASSRRYLTIAHRLDPDDPEIRQGWMLALPVKERIPAIEAYLAEPRGDDAEDLRHLTEYLQHLRKLASDPPKPCKLVSGTRSTELPIVYMMRDATHVLGLGLDVKLNNRTARLMVDTGVGGLLVSSAVAKRAGLSAFSDQHVGGIGDEKERKSFTTYADSIRIGALEFQNCPVRVIDGQYMPGEMDGLIGTDVFSRFLVTLNYPARKLGLAPLPPRPGEEEGAGLRLSADKDDEDEDAKKSAVSAPPGTADSAAPTPPSRSASRGPYDRYIAPEMKDYTKAYRVGHDLLLPARLNGDKIRLFILDTGSFATTISPKAAREVTKVYEDYSTHIAGIDGEVKRVYSAREITFRFANLSQKVDNVVAFDTARISKEAGMEVSGLLGANTLFQVTMHIDYRDGLVKFDYDPKHNSPR